MKTDSGAAGGGGTGAVTVPIYAPADSVATFTSHKPDRWFWKGTSFAAPLVSGAAALLFSFDPRLRAEEVRDLLIASPDTARSVAGVMFLDAYRAAQARGRSAGCSYLRQSGLAQR